MTEIRHKAPHDIERENLQDRLVTIDSDVAKLQGFIGELYNGAKENPHVMYLAAAHLTSLTYLERRDHMECIVLPTREEAGKAFVAYAQLIAILNTEKIAPLYVEDERIGRYLAGTREELAFHATLAYATAQGGDFVALTPPADVDFDGGLESRDLHIFFDGSVEPDLEIQVKYLDNRRVYHPRIAVLSLSAVLGSPAKAAQLRGVLKQVGENADGASLVNLPGREDEIVMNGAVSIMTAARAWDASAPLVRAYDHESDRH